MNFWMVVNDFEWDCETCIQPFVFFQGNFFSCVSLQWSLVGLCLVCFFTVCVCVKASDNTVCFEAFYLLNGVVLVWCGFMNTAYLIQTGLPDVWGISWHHREDVTSAGFLPDFHGNVCFPSWWRTQPVWMNLQASLKKLFGSHFGPRFFPPNFDFFFSYHHNSCVDDSFTLLLCFLVAC